MFSQEFRGKLLPQPNCEKAWQLGLETFQSGHDAVVLSGELTLNPDANGPLFLLNLDPLKVGGNNRVVRRFGADRVLQLLIPTLDHVKKTTNCSDADVEEISRWLNDKEHYFLGRRWGVFYFKKAEPKRVNKGNNGSQTVQRRRIWLFAGNGDSFRAADGGLPPGEDAHNPSKRQPITRFQLLDYLIGFGNSNQQLPKLFSRIGLSLTDTRATVVLKTGQIHHCSEDIVAPGTGNVMNDGIGRMSPSMGANVFAKIGGKGPVPCAFQARFGSAKGIWIIHDDPELGDGDWIVTYPSQRKWNCSFEDEHHRTFEVKDYSKPPRQAYLNQQFIPLLEAQAHSRLRMREALAANLRKGLQEKIDGLTLAMKDALDLRLEVWQHGRSTTASRLNGHAPFLGGLPRDKEESIAYLLDMGIDANHCKYLQNLCKGLALQRAETLKEKMNIPVKSTYLFMVVDFDGILEEDEVSIIFSENFSTDDFCDMMLDGMELLVARAPAHLPSDIQKVKVVFRPQLRHLKDVIVFPIKGALSLAAKLNGGDYDGDRAISIWDREIVQNFRNFTDLSLLGNDSDLVEWGVIRKVDMPLSQIRQQQPTPEGASDLFLREAFKFSMNDNLLGICTDYKERYCHYTGNVINRDVVVLSRLLSCLVDQEKQGFVFTKQQWNDFLKGRKLPRPGSLKEGPDRLVAKPGVHILDYLQGELKATVDKRLDAFAKALTASEASYYDADLTAMFNRIDEEHASDDEWLVIKRTLRGDIDRVADEWSRRMSSRLSEDSYEVKVGALYRAWQAIQPPPALRSSPLVRTMLEFWNKDRGTNVWELLKASFAFKRHYKKSEGNFVWTLAAPQLGILKQKEKGGPAGAAGPVMVQPGMWAGLRPDQKHIMARHLHRLGTGVGETARAMVDEDASEYDASECDASECDASECDASEYDAMGDATDGDD
ncbi:uncharacterized protein UV8b_03419 [Ustilaginoidea virens]|uniref:RNA-dependent RNA polymerase n=1 Tax=Ustilaginoidea virens TaxID=1159556 RepID=A0A8E5HPU6_USTVR|nr:uncharacterized protein UV8b_03419 [Ustilaginoidea virens]QUC19178.1 hypothetical protein UV8b_03419 [Ustilaginoidea virens]